jgi:two-component system, OmpR family, sensor histidine kinase BaeS
VRDYALGTQNFVVSANAYLDVDGVRSDVRDLLGYNLARGGTSEAAGLTLQPETSALDEVLADTAAALRPRIEGQGLHLELQLQTVTADVDRTRVHQMVANLLGNAAKYAGEAGTVTLALRADGADAVIDVIDDGPGVPADELPHVFDRFWRGSTATGTSGTGIGLAVVAAIAEAHGGRTHAGREPGRGSRFTVTLPLSRDLHPVSTRTPSDLHAASQD